MLTILMRCIRSYSSRVLSASRLASLYAGMHTFSNAITTAFPTACRRRFINSRKSRLNIGSRKSQQFVPETVFY